MEVLNNGGWEQAQGRMGTWRLTDDEEEEQGDRDAENVTKDSRACSTFAFWKTKVLDVVLLVQDTIGNASASIIQYHML